MRKVYDLETRQRIVSGYGKSGLSQKRWCEENGISTASFYRWKRSFKEETTVPQNQDVVCLNQTLEISPNMWKSFSLEEENKSCNFVPTISVETSKMVLRMNNDADPKLAAAFLKLMGGLL